jgi:hypothetical protein
MFPRAPADHTYMPLDADRCPPDSQETSEEYLRGTLTASDSRIFEDHYITCANCAQVVEQTALFIDSVRRAAEQSIARKA